MSSGSISVQPALEHLIAEATYLNLGLTAIPRHIVTSITSFVSFLLISSHVNLGAFTTPRMPGARRLFIFSLWRIRSRAVKPKCLRKVCTSFYRLYPNHCNATQRCSTQPSTSMGLTTNEHSLPTVSISLHLILGIPLNPIEWKNHSQVMSRQSSYLERDRYPKFFWPSF